MPSSAASTSRRSSHGPELLIATTPGGENNVEPTQKIGIQCDHCGARFRASPNLAGKQLACPKCGVSLQVASGNPKALPPRWPWLLAGGLGLVLFVLLLIAVWQGLSVSAIQGRLAALEQETREVRTSTAPLDEVRTLAA